MLLVPAIACKVAVKSLSEGAAGADGMGGRASKCVQRSRYVGEGGDHRPGGADVELAGGELGRGPVFEIADCQLEDGVPARGPARDDGG